NVLGFPYIFRGALDVRATKINEAMKVAAVEALAGLAKEDVPETVNIAYKKQNLIFGREYIIPKPVDPRLITRVAPAVAKAAIESGIARKPITDWAAYNLALQSRMGIDNKLIRSINSRARSEPKRVLYGQAENFKVLKAVQTVKIQGLAEPMLLGNREEITRIINENSLDLLDVPIIEIGSGEEKERIKKFAAAFSEKRKRKGITYDEAIILMRQQSYFGAMMVESGDADAFLSGSSSKYINVIRPALQVIGTRPILKHIAGMYILFTKKGPFFFADTTVNRDPDTQTIVDTTLLAAEEVRKFNMEPKIAMVSFSNYGSIRDGSPNKIAEAVKILHEKYPDLIVDGEMQANFALNKELRKKKFPFSRLAEHEVNTIIFPNLNSGNIAYKMMQEIGGAEVIGPILMGMNKPVHILQMESSVREIVYLTAIAVVDAQCAADPKCGQDYFINRVY
ncbi:MAG: NADP-dependent malic enzyme, partial [Bacteroidales bacterium]|nr:NADP-dependent malic enzyme [Bacteroidales bacterium]